MSLPNPFQKALLNLMENGFEKGAKLLVMMSNASWQARTVILSSDLDQPWRSLTPGPAQDHFGSYFSFNGGAFLVLFTQKSGMLVTNRFTADCSDPVDAQEQRESKTLAEVSNILVNALVGTLADASDTELMLSAPDRLIGEKEELFAECLAKYRKKEKPGAFCWVELFSSTLASGCSIVTLLSEDMLERLARRLSRQKV